MRRQFAELRTGPRRTRVLAACGAIAAVALAVGIIIGTGPESSQGASPKKGLGGAATVQRRDLVSTDTESGTLTYANPQTVFNRMSGTITWLPQIGQLVKPGQALYNVDNAPVVLFNGTTPAFRDLTSSDSDGPDILELNQDLKAMGFDPSDEITVNNSWQTGTTNAVEAWQNSLGQTETGTISLGQIVFLPGTQRIDSIDTVLGSTGGAGAASSSSGTGSSGSGSSGSGSSADSGSGSSTSTSYAPKAEFVSLTMTKMVPEAVSAEAQAKATAVENEWSQACDAHDLARLKTLKKEHPKLLAKLQPSSCVQQPASSGPKPTSTTAHPSGTTPTATTSAPATTAAPTTTSAPASATTAPASTASAPSVLSQTLGADMTVPAALRKPGGFTGTGTGTSTTSGTPDNTGAGSLSGGSSSQNATITRALQALLRAETLLLERSAGTSGRGGSSGASSSSLAGGASSTGSAGRGSGGSSGGAAAASGAGLSAGSASTGSSGSAGTGASSSSSADAIIGTTSNQLDVVVDLDATKQSEAVVSEPVSVEMPDGTTVSGKITQVSPVAQSSSSSSGSGASSSSSGSSGSSGATIPVTIALKGRIPASGLDQAAVSVNFQQQVANNVLSVPVTALLATQGGGYAVQEAVAPYKLLPVSVGLFAAGYVQISSSQIYPGLQITDSQG